MSDLGLITTDLVSLDTDLGTDAAAVIGALATQVAAAGRAGSADRLRDDALAREAQSATGLPWGIAIPHCRSTAVSSPTLAFARLRPAADFGAADGGADLVFLIAAPEGGDSDHLTLLSALARSLVRPDFTAALRAAPDAEAVVSLVNEAIAPDAAPTAQAAPTAGVSIVAVTACPTGIAHTYMAADALTAAADRAGVTLTVETQGSSGSTPVAADVLRRAGAVIFATDVGVKDRSRFVGKPVVASGVKRAINDPDAMIADAVAAASDPAAATVQAEAKDAASEPSGTTSGEAGIGLRLRQWLLTGVSYMIPFVAAGGLLIALGFLLGGYELALTPEGGDANNATLFLQSNSLLNLPDALPQAAFDSSLFTFIGALLFLLGGWAFSFLVPALAGYIAYAMADRPGIAPGFVMGFLANQIGAGFLGGIVGGLLAGLVAGYLGRRPTPRWLAGLMPVVVIPLVTTIVAGLLMLLVLGRPIADAADGLTDWLNGLSGGSVVLLGAILGAMMAFDLGGPVNKAAYVFATTGLTAGAIAGGDSTELKIMAAVMISGMTPPLAMALSTVLRPRLYSNAERENGKAAWLLGASFISEGTIPFAAADPLRVIPAMMLGSSVAGAMAMGTGVTLAAPHGGIFVLFAVDNVAWFLASLLVGTVISAIAVTALKEVTRPADSPVTDAPVPATV
ncbi:phosphotransferase system, EIIC [Aeromicrobium marinum DSM 15272]|uniref:Phosphotransferase system, EIIC n=1 Tax=Aeromicrobium marinum DSM 15272 TaxID=585531 RepID=E2SCU7_9ACTN|nr:fructose-specific PTS transporter subunit EIIC [Aeromicrobium marinum]EFQ83050.1 phosphotransferase system, EIIC [Aeromicrobium marinum DSM 15272]